MQNLYLKKFQLKFDNQSKTLNIYDDLLKIYPFHTVTNYYLKL